MLDHNSKRNTETTRTSTVLCHGTLANNEDSVSSGHDTKVHMKFHVKGRKGPTRVRRIIKTSREYQGDLTHPVTERHRPGYRSNTSTQRPNLLSVLWTSPALAFPRTSVLPRDTVGSAINFGSKTVVSFVLHTPERSTATNVIGSCLRQAR